MFKDTSRYLYDIFTIDNPEFEKHIPDMYPTELQLNKANTPDKETSFLDLNIKVIGNEIHISFYDKRDDFGFLIVNFPWSSGDVPRLPSYGVYISQLVRFARCYTSVSDFHSKNLQSTSIYYTIPFGFSLFWHFLVITFQLFILHVWLRITDEVSVPEMRIWSISFIYMKYDKKWCKHLSRSLYLNSKLLTQRYRCHKLWKSFGKLFRSCSDLL